MVSELSPLPAKAFLRPVADYKTYAERWTARAERDTGTLRRTLTSGDSRGCALGLGDRLERLPAPRRRLLACSGISTKRSTAPPAAWPGEPPTRLRRPPPDRNGLVDGADSPRSLVAPTGALLGDLRRLRGAPAGREDLTRSNTRPAAHEILEDAQRDLLSGMDVPWSGQGVLGTAAGVAATEEVFHTLEPLLSGRENTEGEVRSELACSDSAIASVRRDHHGCPSLAQLTTHEHEQLNGYVAGALSALE